MHYRKTLVYGRNIWKNPYCFEELRFLTSPTLPCHLCRLLWASQAYLPTEELRFLPSSTFPRDLCRWLCASQASLPTEELEAKRPYVDCEAIGS